MNPYPRVYLKPGRDRSVLRYHPWVFSGAVARKDRGIQDGDIVAVYSADGDFRAIGHYGSESIAIKILSFQEKEIDQVFWRDSLYRAFIFRERLGLVHNAETNAYRLVNAEGDLLSGLIIDIYGITAVCQFHSRGMAAAKNSVSEALQEIYGTRLQSIYARTAGAASDSAHGEYLLPATADRVIIENGMRFEVDWEKGQKTGFYLDQRENRALIQLLAKGKRVLNCFSYTGGFSLYALRGGADHVTSIDVSASAVEILSRNLALNFVSPAHTVLKEDCLDYLSKTGDRYNLIILDPPAFAKHRNAVNSAIKGYRALNEKGLRCLEPGGTLVSFSCSQLVTRDDLLIALSQAAAVTGRKMSIIRELHQAPCHPVSVYHPEGVYLKGFVLQSE